MNHLQQKAMEKISLWKAAKKQEIKRLKEESLRKQKESYEKSDLAFLFEEKKAEIKDKIENNFQQRNVAFLKVANFVSEKKYYFEKPKYIEKLIELLKSRIQCNIREINRIESCGFTDRENRLFHENNYYKSMIETIKEIIE